MTAFTKTERLNLKIQLDELKAFAASHGLKTNEGREIVTRLIRLLETLADGSPSTDIELRHHP